jgi:uncharacterized 2Fe-2S/4Fe-4S cluster protein (DUF4445 family)
MQLKSAEQLAVAVDIGTTTLAASLIDRDTGRRLAFCGRANPQRKFGSDVVSRLQAACEAEGVLRELSLAINQALEDMSSRLIAEAGADWSDIGMIALAGNPSMEHFALGLPVRSIAFLPFHPLFSEGQTARTSRLGWKRDLDAYFFPLPGGFVGGDLVAFLFGARRHASAAPSNIPAGPINLYLDLGTNGEIALETGDTIWATSAASGPAFEGGNLTCGMPALPGAIDGVEIDLDRVGITTIAGTPPVGICGSGVINAVSALLDAGVLDQTGRIRTPDEIDSNLANRVVDMGGSLAFVLSRNAAGTVYLAQEDIRQVQLAKAAIRAGIEVLFGRAGISDREVKQVVVTGAFGAVLDPRWLKKIGIFSENMVTNGIFIREGALGGVESSLSEPGGIAAIEELGRRIRVIPLSGTPVFEKHFLEQMNFPGKRSAD